jgi:hypothetical protein
VAVWLKPAHAGRKHPSLLMLRDVAPMPARRISMMIARLYRPLVTGLLPVALIACMNPPPTAAEPGDAVPLGIDLAAPAL